MVAVGESIGRYRIESLLGEGGMGTVFRAHDQQLDRRVAIKLVRPSSTTGGQAEVRLMREARAAAALDHPNAVAVYDVGEHEGAPFIVMEYVEGTTLRKKLGEQSPSWTTRLHWMLDVARALASAHARSLVHRDIKPDNVMLRDDGTIKVVDFGIARAVSAIDPEAPTRTAEAEPAIETLTAEGVQVGTIHYMAPEQVRGAAVDGRTDQFAWGVCAYELLCGKQPWAGSGTALSVAAAILTDEAPALSESAAQIPARVSRAVARAMSKRPDDRFPSMDALIAELEAASADDETPQPRAPEKETPQKKTPGKQTPSAPAADLRRYSSQEMRLVIDRALHQQAKDEARFSHDELLQAAREIGVDDAALGEALEHLDEQAPESVPLLPGQEGWWNEERRREAYRFVRHLLVYAVVNLVVWLMLEPHWQRWMLLGWGLGVALHGVNVIMPEREEDDKKSKGADKARRKRVSVPLAADLERAATALRETGERRRLRIVGERSDVARSLEAEAEAEASEEQAAARRR